MNETPWSKAQLSGREWLWEKMARKYGFCGRYSSYGQAFDSIDGAVIRKPYELLRWELENMCPQDNPTCTVNIVLNINKGGSL